MVGQNNSRRLRYLHLLFLLQLHFLPFSSSSVVTIGFDVASYTITESTNSVSVSVSVQSGSLARDVIVTVETMDSTATGGGLIH